MKRAKTFLRWMLSLLWPPLRARMRDEALFAPVVPDKPWGEIDTAAWEKVAERVQRHDDATIQLHASHGARWDRETYEPDERYPDE